MLVVASFKHRICSPSNVCTSLCIRFRRKAPLKYQIYIICTSVCLIYFSPCLSRLSNRNSNDPNKIYLSRGTASGYQLETQLLKFCLFLDRAKNNRKRFYLRREWKLNTPMNWKSEHDKKLLRLKFKLKTCWKLPFRLNKICLNTERSKLPLMIFNFLPAFLLFR